MQSKGRIGSYGRVLVKIGCKSTRCACNVIPCWRICQNQWRKWPSNVLGWWKKSLNTEFIWNNILVK